MGKKLNGHLAMAGFEVEAHRILNDQELSFQGSAAPDVLQAWADRLARMHLLQERARQARLSLNKDFLGCLGSPAHTTNCCVHFCIGRRT